jgi:serine/threonine protein kinase
MNLDHRDLKANNLYIRKRPISYSVIIHEKKYTVEAPFQVVILDFGFACLGNEEKISRVNLAPSNFPDNDPCPKEGRDLFQLLVSFWSIGALRNMFSAGLQEIIDGWLQLESINYSHLAKQPNAAYWLGVKTTEPTFQYPELCPNSLLQKIDAVLKFK